MFGIMGIGSAFMQAGSNGVVSEFVCIKVTYDAADPTIWALSCAEEFTVISTKNGEVIKTKYPAQDGSSLSVQSDANTEIIIRGNLTVFKAATPWGSTNCTNIDTTSCKSLIELNIQTKFTGSQVDLSENTELSIFNSSDCENLTALNFSANTKLKQFSCGGCTNLTTLDFSANTELEDIDCSGCTNLTTLDFSANTELTQLNCGNCTSLTVLDLSSNTKLVQLLCSNSTSLTTIKSPAISDNVSTAIASAITAATSDNGTVYTDSAGAYYSTIADAATAKGWTIEQL